MKESPRFREPPEWLMREILNKAKEPLKLSSIRFEKVESPDRHETIIKRKYPYDPKS